MSIVGVLGVVWMFTLHFVLNHFGAKKDYYLVRKWMIMMNEMPTKKDADYQVVGLSSEANKKFWAAEKYLNWLWFRVITSSLVVVCIAFCAQQFFIPFDVEIVTYALLQTVHIVLNSIGIIGYLHSLYTVNLFYLEVMKLLAKKFAYLSDQVNLLGQPKTDIIDDRQLSKLIYEFNCVEDELLTQNNLFKSFLGANVIYYFGAGVLVGSLNSKFDFEIIRPANSLNHTGLNLSSRKSLVYLYLVSSSNGN